MDKHAGEHYVHSMQRALPTARASGLAGLAARLAPSSETTRVLQALWPYIWPHDRPDLRATVLWSLFLILIAKIVTVSVPYTLKWATDALVAATGGAVPSTEAFGWLIGAPILAAVFYGASRILMTLLVQLREGLFAKVAMHAVR